MEKLYIISTTIYHEVFSFVPCCIHNISYKIFFFDIKDNLISPFFLCLIMSLFFYGFWNPETPPNIKLWVKVRFMQLKRIIDMCDKRGYVTTADKLRMIAIITDLLRMHRAFRCLSRTQAKELKEFLDSII